MSGASPDCRVGRSLGGCVPAFRYIPFRAIAQAQAVVGREQWTAPTDRQCVEDAEFAQRTPVVPGVGEEFCSPGSFRRAAFGADDEGFAQCRAGDVFVARIAGGGFV